jgi:deoxyribodipyrimidine photo-lyase
MKRIIWFRRDLRVEDHPLLSLDGEVLPIFIFDTEILSKLPSNDRRVTFIYNTLLTLKKSLQDLGLDLAVFYGKPTDVFKWLLSHDHYDEVCASGDYDADALKRDLEVSHLLPFTLQHDTYIFRPDEVLKHNGTPYLVFTPFYNRVKTLFSTEHMRSHLQGAQTLIAYDYSPLYTIHADTATKTPLTLEAIGFEAQLLPDKLCTSPLVKLDAFARSLGSYSKNRDFMGLDATSQLSTDLRFGTISIRAVLRWILTQKKLGTDTESFFRELIFREFYAMLLYHFPHLSERNFRYPFKGVPNDAYYEAFCTAKTGVPIIDAGVHELLKTGEMHNRVRMITASFFTKNLLLPWQWGEAFFAKHLNDYDASSNILSWQWSAGTGVDPQPYFRIFNPYTQSEKFDKEATYLYKWLPQLAMITPKTLYNEVKLRATTIDDYPSPIVDQKISAKRALEYFSAASH